MKTEIWQAPPFQWEPHWHILSLIYIVLTDVLESSFDSPQQQVVYPCLHCLHIDIRLCH